MKKMLVLLATAAALVSATGSVAASEERSGPRSTEASQAGMTLVVRNTRYGRILFDGQNRVLYGFTRDKRNGPSRCYGACAAAWPVYFSKATVRAGSGVKRSLIGSVRRRDGRRQVTYNGWPLYYYVDDGPGEVKCQKVDEFGGLWLVVKPSGALLR